MRRRKGKLLASEGVSANEKGKGLGGAAQSSAAQTLPVNILHSFRKGFKPGLVALEDQKNPFNVLDASELDATALYDGWGHASFYALCRISWIVKISLI